MIQARDRKILIDGTPRIIMCGEVHYFRLARDDWAGRLTSLKDAGCTAVASYIPWLWHELPDATIDVTGRTRPERDVAAFIDLCREHDLWFIARPGPFVMAELKNEGLPYRLYTEHPEIVPPTWDGRPAHLGRTARPDPHRRLPRPGLPRRDPPLVRHRPAAHRRTPPAARRQRHRGPARQRGRHAVVGQQQPRPHRRRARGPADLPARP
jgi:hypothetical protein